MRVVGVADPGGPDAVNSTWIAECTTAGDELAALGRSASDGAITLRVAQTFAAAGAAHERLEQGGTRGRLVIEL